MAAKLIPLKIHLELLAFVESKGGRLISGRTTSDGKVTIECEFGHQWSVRLAQIRSKKTWCGHKECLGRRVAEAKRAQSRDRMIEKLHSAVRKNGGRWDGEGYENNSTPVSIDCGKGHRIDMAPVSIFAGSWCRICAGKLDKTDHLRVLQDVAQQRGGELLSTEYQTAKTHYEWRCDECKTTWQATADAVKRGSWCPHCRGGIKLTDDELLSRIQGLIQVAKGELLGFQRTKGGKNKSVHIQVHYLCENGHENLVGLINLERGHGCDLCSRGGISEHACRVFFEHLLGARFVRVKPDWLRNDEGTKLELDGFNESLRLAFEYQGQQHYEFVPFFHGDQAGFKKRLLDDAVKRTACAERGITLLEVPYTVALSELEEWLRRELLKSGFEPITGEPYVIDSMPTRQAKEILELKLLAEERGGRLLSEVYYNNSTPMLWECSAGHDPWWAVPSSIKGGSWCRACANTKLRLERLTPIEQIAPLLELRGWELLQRDGRKLRVRCENKHEFATDYGRLTKPLGCQSCGKLIAAKAYRMPLEEIRETARTRGGTLISKNIIKASQKALWQCAEGHVWAATVNSVRRGSWCPVCYNSKRRRPLTESEVESYLAAERIAFEQMEIQTRIAEESMLRIKEGIK